MPALLLIGFLAGMIAGISPCILPLLPVLLVGWATPAGDVDHPLAARRRRAVSVVLGLVLSFALVTALGSVVLSALDLPQDLLRNLGIVLIILFGIGLLVPQVERWLERPFQRFARSASKGTRSGFVFGLGLGLVFVPCAGPVLAAISTLGATHRESFYSVALSFCFAAGAAVPLLAIALAGDRLIERNKKLSQRSRQLRPLAGALLIVMAIVIAFNGVSFLQRAVPTYTAALQRIIEQNSFTTKEIRTVKGQSNSGSLVSCENVATSGFVGSLQDCGRAPNFTGINAWLNTPHDNALSLSQLKGHVVLVDFWTYSCINCQRTLPHVEAWSRRYGPDGLVVVGVEAPEFAFEHEIGNIRAATQKFGLSYPVAVDDNLATWNAYKNEYWPAEYLIDATGVIRHVDYGEGDYGQEEGLIRQLLTSAHPQSALPAPTSIPDLTPQEAANPEKLNDTTNYGNASTPPLGYYSLGQSWLATQEFIEAIGTATIRLGFEAEHVYLVLGGQGTVNVSVNGTYIKTIHVSGFPTLYDLYNQTSDKSGQLLLTVSSGVQAYDFTFG